MRILIFCTANLNLGSGSEVRARLIAQGLREHGADVFVVAGGIPPDFSEKQIGSILIETGATAEQALRKAVTAFQPDVIIGVTEALTTVVARVARDYRLPYVFDLHGLGFVEVLELGAGYGSRFRRCLQSLRWLQAARSARFVVSANPMLSGPLRIFNQEVIPLVGMADTNLFCPLGRTVRLGKSTDNVQMLYAGNFFKWQGVELLGRAILQSLRQLPKVEWTFIGSVGNMSSTFRALKNQMSSNRVHFLPSIDFREVSAYFRGADVLLIPRPWILSTYLAFPQKIVDYMATGRTVIATDIGPHRWALGATRAGILCRPSPEGIVGAFRKALDPTVRSIVSSRARQLAMERFDYRRQTHILLNHLQRL